MRCRLWHVRFYAQCSNCWRRSSRSARRCAHLRLCCSFSQEQNSIRCGDLTFKLFECEPNAWIGNADAPAISFSEGFDFLDSAIVLVSPGPHNRQFVFEHDARYMIFEPIFD